MKKAADLRIPFTWKDRRPVLLDRFFYLPGHYDHSTEKPLVWEEVFCGNRPVTLEYCSGNGQWICDMAQKHPQINWVAIEKRFDRSRLIWVRLHKLNLPNLLVVCGEGLLFTRHYVPNGSIAQIFVNFPDPWPKLRHAKHRLIRAPFLEAVEEKLAPRSRAMFTTDDRPYSDQMVREVAKRSAWKPVAADATEFGSSFFLELWKSKGRAIHHLHFEVNA